MTRFDYRDGSEYGNVPGNLQLGATYQIAIVHQIDQSARRREELSKEIERLVDQLKDVIPGKLLHDQKLRDWKYLEILDISLRSGEWYLQGEDDSTFRIHIVYEGSAAQKLMKDCTLAAGAPSQPAVPLREFLEQFHAVNSQWTNSYEDDLEELIKQSALYQEGLLSRISPVPVDLLGEDTLIALTLRCLMFTHEISMVDGNFPFRTFIDERENFIELKMFHDDDPLVDISRLLPTSRIARSRTTRQDGTALALMIHNIIRISLRMLIRGNPQDWPCLFYVLCLLRFIRDDLSPLTVWMSTLNQAGHAIDKICDGFCDLYHLYPDGSDPLAGNWSLEAFESAVGNDELMVEHFQRINNIWLDGLDAFADSGLDLDADRLGKRIDNVVYAFLFN